MKLRVLALASMFALSLSATGCKKGGGAMSDEQLVEQTVTMMESFAKAITDAGDDCGKMAGNLEAFMAKNEGTMKDLKAKAEEYKKDEKKQEKMKGLMEKHKDRMEKVMPAMMATMKCAEDPKMKALEGKLKGMMGG